MNILIRWMERLDGYRYMDVVGANLNETTELLREGEETNCRYALYSAN